MEQVTIIDLMEGDWVFSWVVINIALIVGIIGLWGLEANL